MHHQLFTLRPHGDVNKFEVEDGAIRGAVATLLSERSSITDVLVDIPRVLEKTQDAFDVPGADDAVLIAISAEEEIDAQPDMSKLSENFATVATQGEVDRIEVVERDRSWPGTATPGTAVRFRANSAPGIDTPSLTNWVKEVLLQCAEKLPDVGIRTMMATGTSDLTTVNISLSFPPGADPADTLTSRALKPFLDSELLDTGSLTVNMITEHWIFPNPQTWI